MIPSRFAPPAPDPQSLIPDLAALLDWHKRRYPLLQARDIYKLIHQSVFGPGHIISSADCARQAVEDELAPLQVKGQKSKVKRQKADEVLVEPIDPRGELVRVNLRPFLEEVKGQKAKVKRQNRGRGDMGWLVEALVESARRVKGDPEQMRRRLTAVVRWCRTSLPLQAAGLARIAVEAKAAGFPALHHSPAYQRAYRPAYRVVLTTCLNPRAKPNRRGRTKPEVRSEKLECRVGSGTSDI